MTAAIYARKSTDQSGVSDDQKSVARQIDHATAYARAKGWTVRDEHVFVDDGVSGAEFANRPGYMRLLNSLKPPVPFSALIVSELSRIGREQLETGYAVKQLSQAGVKIFSYLEDREILLDTPTDKFLMSAVNFAAEIEREKARQRMVDAMTRKARSGHVCGGTCFGYDNHEVTGRDGQRSHVERRINEPAAAVVRRIFALAADGYGLTKIARQLNDEGLIAPRPQRGRPAGWAPSTVREILHRELYRGVIVWNKSQKRDKWGKKHQQDRPETDWLRVPVPDLRIVDDEVWNASRHGWPSRARHTCGTPAGGCGAVPRAGWSPSTCYRDWRGAASVVAGCTSEAASTARGARSCITAVARITFAVRLSAQMGSWCPCRRPMMRSYRRWKRTCSIRPCCVACSIKSANGSPSRGHQWSSPVRT